MGVGNCGVRCWWGGGWAGSHRQTVYNVDKLLDAVSCAVRNWQYLTGRSVCEGSHRETHRGTHRVMHRISQAISQGLTGSWQGGIGGGGGEAKEIRHGGVEGNRGGEVG